jgi:arginyl-tRNA synthetase
MVQQELAEQIRQAIAAAQEAGALPAFEWDNEVIIERPRKAEHGDFATPVALKLAKPSGSKPRDVAERIAAHLETGALIASAEIAGPGFINLRLHPDWLTGQVDAILEQGSGFAELAVGEGVRTQVEFVSANPTGPLTVGHARGAVLGDTLASLLEAAGYEVTREYYFNNAGLQMESLGETLQIRYLELLGDTSRSLQPGRHYEGEYMQWIAATLHAFHGDSWRERPVVDFKDLAVDAIFAHIRHTLSRLGIEFDVYFNENSLYDSGEVDGVLEELKRREWLYFNEGAWWFKATEFGKEKDRVFIRSSGMPTYRVPDIAYHRNKLSRFDKVVDILGADHKDAFPDVVDALKALGEETEGIGALIHQFTTLVRDGEEVKMSTRRATYVTLDELIDEVGADAVRYFMLAYSPTSQMTFDINVAKSQKENENPVIYIQYAHARACGILEREAPRRGIEFDPEAATTSLTEEAEAGLINEIMRLKEVIMKVAETLEPHHIAYYARDLAASFNNFYDKCPVLRSDVPPELQQARLKLVAAARLALARTLALMSMNAPTEITREQEAA